MQVYDIAWSPSGEYLITGSTDNVARIFSTSDGEFWLSQIRLSIPRILFWSPSRTARFALESAARSHLARAVLIVHSSLNRVTYRCSKFIIFYREMRA